MIHIYIYIYIFYIFVCLFANSGIFCIFAFSPSLLSPNGGVIYTDCTRLKNTVAVALFSWNIHFFREICTDFSWNMHFSGNIHWFSWNMHFFQKKKPLREAAQRIRGFYPEKKAPAGGRTTDKGFLSRKKSPCGRPHNG